MSKELIPKIRFKGYTEAWEQRKLLEVADYRNGKAHENDIDPNGKYIVVNSKFVSTEGEIIKYSTYRNEPIEENEIAFVLSDVPNGKAIAKTYLIEKSGKYTLNQRIAGIKPHDDINPKYLSITMNRNKYFLKFDDGVKQTNLSLKDVLKYENLYPSKLEQDKIGSVFENIDNLITLHQRKYDKLLELKKSLLEKMFPKNNQIYPEIRFNGYAEAWEQRKLSSLSRNVGTGKSKYNISQFNKYAILGSRGVIGYDNKYDYSGDFILTARVGEYAGELYRYNGNVKITDNTVYIQGDNLDYLYYLLKQYDLKKLSFGSGQPLVKASELSNLELKATSDSNEKRKISALFSEIDNLITLHQRKHEKLIKIKESLLNDMFV